MDSVTVKRDALLAKLKTAKENHTQLYKDAAEGYQKETVRQLEETILRVKHGELVDSVRLEIPHDFTHKYDEVIAMLEMSVDDEIELTQSDFNRYVLDKWINQDIINNMRVMASYSGNGERYQ